MIRFVRCSALGFVVAVPVTAQSVQERADLHDRITRMEAQVSQLETAQRGVQSISAARAEELRAIVRDVLSDAGARANLLSAPNTDWGEHTFLVSQDGDFKLEIETRLQIRYVFNHQDDAAGVDPSRGGFEGRRIRSIFSGQAFDPLISYKIQATYDRRGGAFELEDAFVEKEFENGFALKLGQFRPPLTRESNVSTFRTTAVERAIAHGAIEISRTQGVEVGWSNERFDVRASFHDGDGFANSPALMADTEFGLAARGEALIAGDWRQFRDFTGWSGDKFGLLVGAGVNYDRGEFGAPGSDRADGFRWTVDASAEFDGAHLYGMFGGREIRPDSEGAGDDIDVLVAVLQGGVFITEEMEAFGRFEWGDDDSDEDLAILTVGLSRFWDKHNLKWQFDVGYAFDAVTGTFASSGAGWREDPSGGDGQVVLRTQLQLCF